MAILEINWRPVNRDLRLFAIVQLVVAAVCAWLLHRRLGAGAVAIGLLSASLIATAAGLMWPQVLRPLFVVWMAAAFPVGWVMSHLMLGIVYYGVVTPIGFALRWRGRDALQIKSCPEAETYWSVRPPAPEPTRYFRQF
jgi:cytochrome bd-type quinol oxidase subunit 2